MPVIGIGGTSMGGDIAVAAAGLERRIGAVATCIATADWLKPGSIYKLSAPNPVVQAQYNRYNPLTNLDRYRHCPALSFQCSSDDPMVPADGAERFVQALAPIYAACPERLEVVRTDADGHQCTAMMLSNAVQWLARFL